MRDMTKCRGRRPLPKIPDMERTFRDVNEPDLDLIFRGSIRNGALFIESEIHAEYDSEKVYTLSRCATGRLFSLLTVEEFTKLCREGLFSGLR